MKIYEAPIFFEKNRVYRVYTGGKLLGDFLGDNTEDGNYPEEWIASTVEAVATEGEPDKAGVSKVEGSDIWLDALVENYKKEILGNKSELGILVKFLDSAIRLPIQAHPDKEYSRKHFSSEHGKEESWIILGKRPGGCIYFGFEEGVTREEFSKAIEESENNKNAMDHLIVKREVEVGDVVFVPARAVHAIGAGCLILEIQEPTDFTIQPEYWCGETKLSKELMYLGLDKETGLDCFDFAPIDKVQLAPEVLHDTDGLKLELLIGEKQTKNFSVNRITLSGASYLTDKTAGIYIVIKGEGKLIGSGYERKIKQGDYFLLPHEAINKYSIQGNLTVVECYA